jgi:nitrous oxide reductase
MSTHRDEQLNSRGVHHSPAPWQKRLLAAAASAAVSVLGLTAVAHAVQPHAAKPDPHTHVYLYTVRWVSREGGPAKAYKKFGEAYGFDPGTIAVTQGETVTISIRNLEGGPDDLHTFTLPAYRIDRSIPPLQTVNVTFKADRAGVFPLYCDHHKPWMSGELIVLPAGHE